MLGQPHAHADPRSRGLQADRQAARRRHRDRPRAHRHADAAQEGRGRQVRRVLRRRPRRHAAGRPRHHRQHGAGIRRHLRLLPGRRDHARLSQDDQPRRTPPSSSRPMPRSRACGAPRSRPSRSSPTRSSSTSATSSPAWPDRSARRTACRSPRPPQQFVGNMEKAFDRKDDGKRVTCDGRRLRPRPWRRGDRRHHLLHQHLQPLRHAGRRPDRAQRGEARPEGQALGQDLAGAGLAGRHRISRDLGPAARTSTRSASTWWAMAAPPASAIPVRCPIR